MNSAVISDEVHRHLDVTMETASSTAPYRLLCSIHNIPRETSAVEQWINTVLESDFHVDHCQQIEGKFRKNIIIISEHGCFHGLPP